MSRQIPIPSSALRPRQLNRNRCTGHAVKTAPPRLTTGAARPAARDDSHRGIKAEALSVVERVALVAAEDRRRLEALVRAASTHQALALRCLLIVWAARLAFPPEQRATVIAQASELPDRQGCSAARWTLIRTTERAPVRNTDVSSCRSVRARGLGGPGGYPPGLPRTRTCVH